ncbi:hypothetical protein [Nocardioides speluncae]|nr:hypothetical protein [Nocardioides speluncae]
MSPEPKEEEQTEAEEKLTIFGPRVENFDYALQAEPLTSEELELLRKERP